MELICPSCNSSIDLGENEREEGCIALCMSCGWVQVYRDSTGEYGPPTRLELVLMLNPNPILMSVGQATIMRQQRIMGYAC